MNDEKLEMILKTIVESSVPEKGQTVTISKNTYNLWNWIKFLFTGQFFDQLKLRKLTGNWIVENDPNSVDGKMTLILFRLNSPGGQIQ